ncbi:hypothetical protein [Algibacter sp.]|uniref:hypothetical protein n=1 Tax=Algibacter sp. TaxID=1872428 RepID=UPI003C71DB5E
MNDFLLKNYSLLTHSVEAIAALTGILLFKRYKNTSAKYFIYYLIVVSICDFLGSYTKFIENNGFFSFLEGTRFVRNYWWYTLFWKVLAIVFFTFYYHKILRKNKFKRIIKYSGIAFYLFSVVYIIFNIDDYFNSSLPLISILGAFVIFLCSGLYFLEILLSNKILVFYKSLNFYISGTIFIWWLIVTPLVFFENYNNISDWEFVFLKWQIKLFANLAMYLTFLFALIWCRPQND